MTFLFQTIWTFWVNGYSSLIFSVKCLNCVSIFSVVAMLFCAVSELHALLFLGMSKDFRKASQNVWSAFIHPSWVCYELTIRPAPSWLDSSVGRALHTHCRGHGFESHSSLNFFQSFFSQLLKLHTNCRDLCSIWYLLDDSVILRYEKLSTFSTVLLLTGIVTVPTLDSFQLLPIIIDLVLLVFKACCFGASTNCTKISIEFLLQNQWGWQESKAILHHLHTGILGCVLPHPLGR